MTAPGAYFAITPSEWIALNMELASRPAKARMALSPPGCSCRKEVTSKTSPLSTIQQSDGDLCFATSAKEKAPDLALPATCATAISAGTTDAPAVGAPARCCLLDWRERQLRRRPVTASRPVMQQASSFRP